MGVGWQEQTLVWIDLHEPTADEFESVGREFELHELAVEDAIRRTSFRDVRDHLNRVADEIKRFRDLLDSILQANLTQVGIRQNEDMRKISAWVAIAAVPTMIAGIYGMNFEHMPELGWAFGYPLVLAVMLGVCLGLYRAFRRNGWLCAKAMSATAASTVPGYEVNTSAGRRIAGQRTPPNENSYP